MGISTESAAPTHIESKTQRWRTVNEYIIIRVSYWLNTERSKRSPREGSDMNSTSAPMRSCEEGIISKYSSAVCMPYDLLVTLF